MQLNRPIKPTSKLLLISMASIFSISFLFFLLFHHRSHHHASALPLPIIRQACNATRYPQACQDSLSQLPPDPDPLQIIQSAIRVSTQNLNSTREMMNAILNSSGADPNITLGVQLCLEALTDAVHRTESAVEALPRGRIKDARAWFGASLAYQYGCQSGLSKYVNDSVLVNKTVSFMDTLIGSSSNALSMMVAYDVFGNETALWVPPRTERDGYWEPIAGMGEGSFLGIGPLAGMNPNVTVCKGGACKYATVQEAVNEGPSDGRRFVIGIKEGVYEETVRVPFDKRNVVFLGDGMGKTVITGSMNVGQLGVSTWYSATVGVRGDGFMASGITFENTAGPDAHQAVAFASNSDLSIIENCEFLGNQDTLYAHSLRQFYKSCRIVGNVDFIFGNSASVFQDCLILVRPRQLNPEKGEDSVVAAQGRTDPAMSTGFVFQNCVVNGTDKFMELYHSKPKAHRTFLGRPWKEFSRTVFMNCVLEALISPEGWMPWIGDFALQTLYFGEFDNSGAGANSSQRVAWSSQVPADHVYTYSLQNFIQGDEWIATSF